MAKGWKTPTDNQMLLFQGVDAVTAEPVSASSNRYHENGTRQKVLGAVYTPPRVAAALTRWAVRSRWDRVLDPSCGEGVFLSAARTRLGDLGARQPQCVGVDIDPKTAAAAGAVCADFFAWARTAPRFDAVVGNPPFVRSHLFPEASRSLAFGAMQQLGVKPSRLMSTWAPFLAICAGILKDNGRLAMVIPEELFHVGYAEELRAFLLRRFARVIVCLPSRDMFPDVQQAVILLLCDNETDCPHGLMDMEYSALEKGAFDQVSPAKPWAWNSKWTHLFLSPQDRSLVDQWWPQLDWKPFRAYASVEVGVVTGDNRFFVLNQEHASRFDKKHLVPVVTSAKDLRGIRFDAADFRQVLRESRPAFLLNVGDPVDGLPQPLRAYLEEGQKHRVHTRYKCRIREPWYTVPSVWKCDALLLRQSGEMPRLVHLAKKCTATDTVHRVT